MGCFSWLDCVTQKAIRMGEKCYVLVPKEFGGGVIEENSYDCYGRFGLYDIYDLVADWNKESVTSAALREKPGLEDLKKYGGLYSFTKEELLNEGYTEEEVDFFDKASHAESWARGMKRCEASIRRLHDFKILSDEEMRKKYGNDFKRIIGIDIACYDEQNAALKFPIKISHEPAVYENCNPSDGDPNQGFFSDEEEEGEEEW